MTVGQGTSIEIAIGETGTTSTQPNRQDLQQVSIEVQVPREMDLLDHWFHVTTPLRKVLPRNLDVPNVICRTILEGIKQGVALLRSGGTDRVYELNYRVLSLYLFYSKSINLIILRIKIPYNIQRIISAFIINNNMFNVDIILFKDR